MIRKSLFIATIVSTLCIFAFVGASEVQAKRWGYWKYSATGNSSTCSTLTVHSRNQTDTADIPFTSLHYLILAPSGTYQNTVYNQTNWTYQNGSGQPYIDCNPGSSLTYSFNFWSDAHTICPVGYTSCDDGGDWFITSPPTWAGCPMIDNCDGTQTAVYFGKATNYAFTVYHTPYVTNTVTLPSRGATLDTNVISRSFYGRTMHNPDPPNPNNIIEISDSGILAFDGTNWYHPVASPAVPALGYYTWFGKWPSGNSAGGPPDTSLPDITLPGIVDSAQYPLIWYENFTDQEGYISGFSDNAYFYLATHNKGMGISTSVVAGPGMSGGSYIQGDTIQFTGTVQNVSSVGNHGHSYSQFSIDVNNDGTWDAAPYGPDADTRQLAAGDSTTVTSAQWTPPAGTHRIRFCPDVYGLALGPSNGNREVDSLVDPDRCTYAIINVVAPPSKPTGLMVQPGTLACNSVQLQWNASTGTGPITYRVQVHQDTTTGPLVFNQVFSNPPAPVGGLIENKTYYWIVIASGPGGSTTSDWANFTIPSCKRYHLNAGPAIPTLVPGGSPRSSTFSIGINNPSTLWSGSDAVSLQWAIVTTATSCGTPTAHPLAGRNDTGGTIVVTALSPNPDYWSGPGPVGSFPNPTVSVKATAAAAAGGSYNLCLWGTSAPDVYNVGGNLTYLVKINYNSWAQVAAPAGSSYTGDIHSNDKNTPPSIYFTTPGPAAGPMSHFFADGAAGVVSAAASIQFDPDGTATSGAPYWRAAGYTPAIQAPSFASLLKILSNKHAPKPVNLPSQDYDFKGNVCSSNDTVMAGQQGGTSTVTLDTGPLFSSCKVVVIGTANHTVTFDIGRDLTNGPVIFLVSGNIIVEPGVSTINGVFLWTGTFTDRTADPVNPSDSPLTINGALIGLGDGTNSNGSLDLQRSLPNNSSPAEKVIFHPEYLQAMTDYLGVSQYTWTEQQ